MLLRNLHNVRDNELIDIKISGTEIEAILPAGMYMSRGEQLSVNFEDALVFPGLINSHDHIDFNLYPQLGRGDYSSYVEWGTDIHSRCKEAIDKVLNIPKELRIQWGVYKNLLNGITTVVNHGEMVETKNDLIDIYQQCNVLHSARFEKNWRYKLNRPFAKKQPFVLHIGEGRDVPSWEEINDVIKWNIFKRKIYAVHGIAMDTVQARSFDGLIWCPYSNYFLIGKTADIAKLKHSTNILFGTDSTISASWNLWEHIKMARKEKALSNVELFDSLTTAAAKAWNLPMAGLLEEKYNADIVIAKRKKNMRGFEAFYALSPEDILMVLHKGNIRLFDSSLLHQLTSAGINVSAFSKVVLNDSHKHVAGDLPALMKEITSYYHDVVFPVNIAV